jgi:phosphohistidine swiveling domain-containing protein
MAEAAELGRMMLTAETACGGPVEIEWALGDDGLKLLQARPRHVQPPNVPDDIWLQHPGLNGHPAGIGWGTGRCVVIRCECELSRVAPGDILVTRVTGPALSQILPRVSGVVTEFGGSTSHLASLARERGIPMVLGVLGATRAIPDGAQVAVDGSRGSSGGSANETPTHLRHAAHRGKRPRTTARVRRRHRQSDSGQVLPREALLAGVQNCDFLFSLLHDKIDRTVIAANSDLRAIVSMAVTPTDIDITEATRRGIVVTIAPPIVTEGSSREAGTRHAVHCLGRRGQRDNFSIPPRRPALWCAS